MLRDIFIRPFLLSLFRGKSCFFWKSKKGALEAIEAFRNLLSLLPFPFPFPLLPRFLFLPSSPFSPLSSPLLPLLVSFIVIRLFSLLLHHSVVLPGASRPCLTLQNATFGQAFLPKLSFEFLTPHRALCEASFCCNGIRRGS